MEVRVYQSDSVSEGGCNGCSRYVTTDGRASHRVWVISLRGSSLRVCDECRKAVLTGLRQRP